MTIYVKDTTVQPPQEKQFATFIETVRYLEGMTKRAYRQDRKTRMIMLEEIGHGYDDTDSVNFVRSMAEAFEMGVIRNDAGKLRRMRCDITSINKFQSTEYGN